MNDTTGTITYPPLERYEFTFVVPPDPRDARIASQAQAYEALAQECVWLHARIAELEAALKAIDALTMDFRLSARVAISQIVGTALMPSPERDMRITQEAMDA